MACYSFLPFILPSWLPFIIESYKNLQEDPATTTASLLMQMSQQIALLSNGSSTFQAPESFHPATSSLVCNLAWFLALALALTCSLLATFVQQWTRDFLHKTTMRPSPVVQARVLAFSYFGLRRFGMHTFVDTIPILLHISLFFFAGLVAFLLPVNFPLMCLMACVLAIFMLVYLGLSYIPLIFLDAPYRTPFSDFCWRFGNRFHGYITRKHGLRNDFSLNEAIIEKSLQNSSSRDYQCMEYTMKSLNFDTELVPMFEAIPEAVLTPRGGVRLENFKLLTSLIQPSEPDNSIVSRISNFISNSGTSSNPQTHVRNMVYCLEALRSLVQLVIAKPTQDVDDPPVFWFDRSLLQVLVDSDTSLRNHIITIIALVRTSRLQSFKRCIDRVAHVLSLPSTPADERLQMAHDVFRRVSLEDIDWNSKIFLEQFIELGKTLTKRTSDVWHDRTDELVEQAQGIVSRLQNPGRWKAGLIAILGEFLSKGVSNKLIPIDMELTWKIIHSSLPISVLDQSLEIEEDEAAASYALNNEMIAPSVVQPEMLLLLLRLFFSTNHAFSLQESLKCRGMVHSYIQKCSSRERDQLVMLDSDGQLEECVLQDLRVNDSDEPSFCVSAITILYSSLSSQGSNRIPSRLRIFSKQIFDIIPNVSSKFTRDRWWPAMKADTEWILCVDIYNKLDSLTSAESNMLNISTMYDIRTLGGRLMPEIHIPERSDPCSTVDSDKEWMEDVRQYVMSMVVVIISKFITMCSEETGGIVLGNWSWMSYVLFYYEGPIYKEIQLRFAESIQNLVSVSPWTEPRESPASQIFYRHVWQLHQHWSWITDPKSAQVIAHAIWQHKNDPNFKGTLWYEQALLDRCSKIIISAKEAAEQAEGVHAACDDEIRDETDADRGEGC